MTTTIVQMKIVWPLGKLDAPGCSVTCSTCAVVGRGRRTAWLSPMYHAALPAAPNATSHARRLKTRMAMNIASSATNPLASPIQLKTGKVSASGPHCVAWTSRSRTASSGMNG